MARLLRLLLFDARASVLSEYTIRIPSRIYL